MKIILELDDFEAESLEQHLLDFLYHQSINEQTAEEHNALVDILTKIEGTRENND